MDAYILSFFKDSIGGLLITDADGRILYEDKKTAFVRQEKTSWETASPQPAVGQEGEVWELLRPECKKTYMVISSTYEKDGSLIQMHYLTDTSIYTDLYRDMSAYSKTLKDERDHDELTGLFNKGKFLEMKQGLFRNQESIAVLNMDLNFLKYTNDNYGHEAGDQLIKTAAASMKRIEARNVIPFRVGGDEFLVVALHMDKAGAERLKADWEQGLEELNRQNGGIPCVIACGLAYAEKGYDLDQVIALADQRMYEDKKAKKAARPDMARKD